jgi:hypothetical protein
MELDGSRGEKNAREYSLGMQLRPSESQALIAHGNKDRQIIAQELQAFRFFARKTSVRTVLDLRDAFRIAKPCRPMCIQFSQS